MKKLLVASIVLILTTTIIASSYFVTAETEVDSEMDVQVDINEKSIVDIQPASLEWEDPLDPGEQGERQDIQIENLGSVNITRVWLENSIPDEDPFGTADASAYDAGNWITVSRDEDGTDYYFPDRREYRDGETDDDRIIFLTGPDGNQPPEVPYGRFRNSSYEYFWAVDDETDPSTLYVGDEPRTEEQSGTTDLSGTNVNEVSLSQEGDWYYGELTVNGMEICAAYNDDTQETRWYRWNMDAPGADECGNAENFLDEDIVPGASGYGRVRVNIPYGVAYDSEGSHEGTLTVLAQTE